MLKFLKNLFSKEKKDNIVTTKYKCSCGAMICYDNTGISKVKTQEIEGFCDNEKCDKEFKMIVSPGMVSVFNK